MAHPQVRSYFVLAQYHFGSNFLDAALDGAQLSRNLVSDLRQGGLEGFPYACYLALQGPLSLTGCDIVLAARVSADRITFMSMHTVRLPKVRHRYVAPVHQPPDSVGQFLAFPQPT